MKSLRFTSFNVRNLKKNFLFVNELILSSEVCYFSETWLHEGETEEFKQILREYNVHFQCDIETK